MKQIAALRQQVQILKSTEPNLRNRALAHRLGISEAELLSLSAGELVIMLEGDWKELLKNLTGMGYVMGLTRNAHCVHERKGVYDNVKFYEGGHNMGIVLNPDIDLRLFMNEWHYGLAVTMPRKNGATLYSFQFFNKKGEAVHKIFSTPRSNLQHYQQLVTCFRSPSQDPILDIDTSPYDQKVFLADHEIDIPAFQEAWRNLQDTHDFFSLLRTHKIQRTQGFRLAPEGFTHQIDNQAVVRTLQLAAQAEVPIMCFLQSKGCIQIHTGPIKNLKVYGEWYNVLDPSFNLHLKLHAVHETWIVKKPTVDGIVTSLELFDESGNLIVYFFGARKPGKPELETWRQIIEDVQASNNSNS